MATAKMETAAERYRRNKKAQTEIHAVLCECGAEWKCRRADKSFWVTSGILPMSMLDMAAKVAKHEQTEDDIIKTMATDEIIQSVVFSNKVVKYTAVEPRIVETVTDPNDLLQEEVDMCCYNRLRDWQMKGGDEAATLETFRQ
jgi:hypothetical protein